MINMIGDEVWINTAADPEAYEQWDKGWQVWRQEPEFEVYEFPSKGVLRKVLEPPCDTDLVRNCLRILPALPVPQWAAEYQDRLKMVRSAVSDHRYQLMCTFCETLLYRREVSTMDLHVVVDKLPTEELLTLIEMNEDIEDSGITCNCPDEFYHFKI